MVACAYTFHGFFILLCPPRSFLTMPMYLSNVSSTAAASQGYEEILEGVRRDDPESLAAIDLSLAPMSLFSFPLTLAVRHDPIISSLPLDLLVYISAFLRVSYVESLEHHCRFLMSLIETSDLDIE